ncbi:MAG: BadF/BadG/BcrA/BcrD ATPase family protein, partial [Mycobacteriales bacterium]
MDVVLGVDAGGSTTRAVAADPDGTVLGRGEAGGANQRSSPGDIADVVRAALAQAMGDLHARTVIGGHVGVAGAGSAGFPMAAEQIVNAWTSLGLPGTPAVSTDLEVAFVAGTPHADGLL